MPIEFSRVEAGILLQRITGTVKQLEMYERQQIGFDIMRTAGDLKIVLITDTSEMAITSSDLSIAGYKRIRQSGGDYVLQSIIIVTSPVLRIGLSRIRNILNNPFDLAADVETALSTARITLQHYAATPPSDLAPSD